MTASNVNKIFIPYSAYKDSGLFYNKVSETITTLLQLGYIVLTYNYEENRDEVVIEYVHSTSEGCKPIWVTPEEVNIIFEQRLAKTKEDSLSKLKSVFKDDNSGNSGNDA